MSCSFCCIRFRFSALIATLGSPAGSDCERSLSHLCPSIFQLDSVPASDGGRGLRGLAKFSCTLSSISESSCIEPLTHLVLVVILLLVSGNPHNKWSPRECAFARALATLVWVWFFWAIVRSSFRLGVRKSGMGDSIACNGRTSPSGSIGGVDY